MFTLHAFASTTAAFASLTNLPPASDPALAINGNFIFVPTFNQLIGSYVVGATMARAQLTTPSLLADVPYDITPVDVNTLPGTNTSLLLHPQDPIALVTDEPIQALVTKTGADSGQVFIFLADGALTKVSGRILRVRGTFTTPTAAVTWANSQLTLTNQLAEGQYQLVGARVEGAHTIAARFVFPGSSNSIRPGLIASNGKSGVVSNEDVFRNGNMGVWGTFSNRVLPTIDSMGDGTTETATLIMDVIKVA